MTVKVYVDWYGNEILNESEHCKKLNLLAEERRANKEHLHEWLDENYSASDIWKLDAVERLQLEREWADACLQSVKDEDEYEEVFIEI